MPITRGARVSKKTSSVCGLSRYRLSCGCGKDRSVEVELGGFSCSVLFHHPDCRCSCGDKPRVMKWLGWVRLPEAGR